MRQVGPGKVVEDRLRWTDAEGDVDEDARSRRSHATQAARLVDELADALIARPRQSETLGLPPESPVDLGDRNVRIVETHERFDEPR